MKVLYDSNKDILQIAFFEDRSIEETTQIAPGFILDYDEDGTVVGLELRKASQKLDDPYAISYSVGEASTDKPQVQSKS